MAGRCVATGHSGAALALTRFIGWSISDRNAGPDAAIECDRLLRPAARNFIRNTGGARRNRTAIKITEATSTGTGTVLVPSLSVNRATISFAMKTDDNPALAPNPARPPGVAGICTSHGGLDVARRLPHRPDRLGSPTLAAHHSAYTKFRGHQICESDRPLVANRTTRYKRRRGALGEKR
jgi:hypothetical protein